MRIRKRIRIHNAVELYKFFFSGTMSLLLLAANIAIVPLLSPHNDTDINPENKERSVYRCLSINAGSGSGPFSVVVIDYLFIGQRALNYILLVGSNNCVHQCSESALMWLS